MHSIDMQFQTAQDALTTLDSINVDTAPITAPLARWERLRDAVRGHTKTDPAALWEALADGNAKATQKAAVEYMTGQAIHTAAKADPRREQPYQADTMSAVKIVVIDAQPTARTLFNDAAHEYTTAFHDADSRPEPSALITTQDGSAIWARLIAAAQQMNLAAQTIRLAAQFGHRVADQGSGLDAQVPYATGLPHIQALSQAQAADDWLSSREHAPHRAWAHILLAGADLYAGSLDEQQYEVGRLIDQAQDSRTHSTIADLANDEQRALARAMKRKEKSA